MIYYVYILKSLRDKKFYMVCVENLKLRFEEYQILFNRVLTFAAAPS